MKLLIIFSFFCLSCNAQKSAQVDSLKKVVIYMQCENNRLLDELKIFKDSLDGYRKRDEDIRVWMQQLLNRE